MRLVTGGIELVSLRRSILLTWLGIAAPPLGVLSPVLRYAVRRSRYAEAIASWQQHSHPSAVFWTRPTCTASCTASAGDVLVLALGSEIGPAGYTKKPAWDWVPSLSNPLHLTF